MEAGSAPYLVDLARLEWARLEVFDAEDAVPLAMEDLHTLAPDAWPALQLRLIPAFRMFESVWPVQAIWKALEDTEGPLPCYQPAVTCVRVWRQDFTVYHASMDATERAALDSIRQGAPFAAICDVLGRTLASEEAAREAAALLVQWVTDGIIVR
jgi:hypothetical protein